MATREVALLKLIEPTFLSLVDSPANRTGFKIVRSAQPTEGNMAHTDRNIRQRVTKRTDSGLLSIQFPAGVGEAEAHELMSAMALGDDYELVANDDGSYVARRKELEESGMDDSVPVELGGGYVAVLRNSSVCRSDANVAGVTLTGLEFDETFDSADAVKSWLTEREVNFKPGGVEELAGGYLVTRHDTPEGTDVRKVKLGDGVTGLVAKTKDTDVPTRVYRSVVEQAYGNWGWGHLNFAAALVDPEFTDRSWDAIYVLKDVLENIVLYSGLQLEERKALVKGALDQFYQYITALIDSLPRQVLEQAASASRSDNSNLETDPMSTQNQQPAASAPAAAPAAAHATGDPAASSPPVVGEQAPVTATESVATETTPDAPEFVTRAEMETAITTAVAAALAAATPVQRSDDKAVLDALGKITEGMGVITRSVGSLKDEMDELAGKTVTRSDPDTSPPAAGDTGGHKRGDGSPFDGMFGDRFK